VPLSKFYHFKAREADLPSINNVLKQDLGVEVDVALVAPCGPRPLVDTRALIAAFNRSRVEPGKRIPIFSRSQFSLGCSLAGLGKLKF